MLKKLRRRYRQGSTLSPVSISSSNSESRAGWRRHLAVESLEKRYVLTAPTLAAIPSQTLQGGAPLEVPINATSPSGFTLSYSVSSSNPTITADPQTGNSDLVLNVTHTASSQPGDISFSGTIVIELFPTAAPETVAQIERLTNAGDYNGIDFDRVVPGFVAQAGQTAPIPTNVTVNGLPVEFDPILPLSNPSQTLLYNTVGVVGMANTGAPDSGQFSFFIATASNSGLPENTYTIFGQVVSGMNILTDIANVPNPNSGGDNVPYSPVTITKATITTDNNDFALGLTAPSGSTQFSGTVTVTANDGHGGVTSQSFVVNPGPAIMSLSTTVPAHSAFDAGGSVPITVTFADPVDVTGTPTLTLNDGGVATYVSGSGTSTLTFSYQVAAGQNIADLDYASTAALSLNGGTIGDSSGDVSPLTLPATGIDGLATEDIVVDTVAPTVAITSLDTNNTKPTITGTVTDPSPSSGIASVTVVVNGQTINATVSGTTWSAAVPTALGNGTYSVQATATDKAGNSHITTAATGLIIDTNDPTVTGVSTTAPATSTFGVGQQVSLSIVFSEVVNVTGTPELNLNDTGVALYTGGSGSTQLTFIYTIAANQNTSDLDYASTAALVLNGGTIKDGAGNAAVLALPTIGTDAIAARDIKISTPTAVVDLAVALTASSSGLPGGGIAYTVKVTNNGPSAAQSVVLSDALPATTSFGSQMQTSGSTFTLGNSGNTVSDRIASLASGSTAVFTIVADLPVTAAAGTINNTVSVSSATPESNSANNSATAGTTVTTTGVMLTTDPINPTETDLVVGGTSGADNISFASAGAGKVTVTMNGKSYGTFAVTGRIVAYAGAGNDEIVVSPAITLPAFLYAGSGTDELVGGSGNNVLVGGGGADTLIGGTGHNILIAGTGPSKLYSTELGVAASAGGGSILIAGSTSYDHNESALSTIMAEWGSSDSYATRVAKISNGSLAGGVALNTSTITASKAADELFASTGYDWFWELSPLDQILNLSAQKKASIQIN